MVVSIFILFPSMLWAADSKTEQITEELDKMQIKVTSPTNAEKERILDITRYITHGVSRGATETRESVLIKEDAKRQELVKSLKSCEDPFFQKTLKIALSYSGHRTKPLSTRMRARRTTEALYKKCPRPFKSKHLIYYINNPVRYINGEKSYSLEELMPAMRCDKAAMLFLGGAFRNIEQTSYGRFLLKFKMAKTPIAEKRYKERLQRLQQAKAAFEEKCASELTNDAKLYEAYHRIKSIQERYQEETGYPMPDNYKISR